MMASGYRSVLLAAAAALALTLAAPLAAQSVETVRFAAGNDNAAVEGSVKGDAYRDYVLGARAGQTMAVSLSSKATAYFNVLAPGSDGTALYNGSLDGADASIELPADGDYTIRVYLMGEAKDAGYTVPFTLSMTVM